MATPGPEANHAALGMIAACEGVARGRPGAWRQSRPGLLALMTTLLGRPYNGLYGLDNAGASADAATLAAELAASGVSWCARLRPSTPVQVDAALHDCGLFEEDLIQLMAIFEMPHDPANTHSSMLQLRTCGPRDHDAIASVLGAAFGTSPASASMLLSPDHLLKGGTEWHLGEVDGVPVTCAMAVTAGDAIGIFAVGTVPDARGMGFGSAVTARAARHGLARGLKLAVLTASPEVQSVYEGIGFRVLESWRRLVPPQ